jgi:hypothetical protein
MKKLGWRVKLGLALVAVSAVLLVVHYLIFRDFHHIAIYGVFDLAMMPLEVLVVTMILHSLLQRREHDEMMHKLNMVIGAFFSEVGSELLRRISAMDDNVEVREHFLVNAGWNAKRYEAAKVAIDAYDYNVQVSAESLAELRAFLIDKRQFLLGLLQNPSLLEHDTFTDMLWAVSHLAEEIEFRPSLSDLPETDKRHLAGDIKRAYSAVAIEWLAHVQHLQKAYPYLFSLAVRMNPLDPGASVTVTE